MMYRVGTDDKPFTADADPIEKHYNNRGERNHNFNNVHVS